MLYLLGMDYLKASSRNNNFMTVLCLFEWTTDFCRDCINNAIIIFHVGSAITEILQPGNDEERAYLESGFCAMLVLYYDDPEKPRLVSMNRVSHVSLM